MPKLTTDEANAIAYAVAREIRSGDWPEWRDWTIATLLAANQDALIDDAYGDSGMTIAEINDTMPEIRRLVEAYDRLLGTSRAAELPAQRIPIPPTASYTDALHAGPCVLYGPDGTELARFRDAIGAAWHDAMHSGGYVTAASDPSRVLMDYRPGAPITCIPESMVPVRHCIGVFDAENGQYRMRCEDEGMAWDPDYVSPFHEADEECTVCFPR